MLLLSFIFFLRPSLVCFLCKNWFHPGYFAFFSGLPPFCLFVFIPLDVDAPSC